MIRFRSRPSRGPTYLQALSLLAAVRVASASLKRMVAAARPIYGVPRHDKERYAPSCADPALQEQKKHCCSQKDY
jgi:hypothetical protein